MKRMPLVKNVMTPFPWSIDAAAPLAEAQAFMRQQGIRHLPVVAGGALAGLLTDRDIKLLLGPEFDWPDAQKLTASETMLAEPYTVDLNAPLDAVLSHMIEHHIGSAIVTRKGKLAGIFTSTDACRVLAELLDERFGVGDDDVA